MIIKMAFFGIFILKKKYCIKIEKMANAAYYFTDYT